MEGCKIRGKNPLKMKNFGRLFLVMLALAGICMMGAVHPRNRLWLSNHKDNRLLKTNIDEKFNRVAWCCLEQN